jgi:hypothetical protein
MRWLCGVRVDEGCLHIWQRVNVGSGRRFFI